MAKRYKYILTLPHGVEVDGEQVDGHMSWPNYSQAEPVVYDGIFDSREDAEKYAAEYRVYKYTLNTVGCDSFEDGEELFLSIYDAEDAVCRRLGIKPGDPYCVHPDRYVIEEIRHEGEVAYKYRLFHGNECIFDCTDEGDYFDKYERAEDWAQVNMEELEISLGGLGDYYSLVPIETVSVRIEEIEG